MVRKIVLAKIVETCSACPSQWNAWDQEGQYWYLRYRFDHGTMGRTHNTNEAEFEFWKDEGGFGGCIGIEEFLERIGIERE